MESSLRRKHGSLHEDLSLAREIVVSDDSFLPLFPLIYTPTGSTAYSMAAGGSVVHPAVPCILVTPICPHVLSFRSMVFPDHVVLRCYVPEDARSPASVSFDGKHRLDLQRGDSVQIQMSAYPVPTLNRGDHSSDWLESLKRSFNFNTRPRQRPL